MSFPETIEELQAEGYEYKSSSSCRHKECGAVIDWWIIPESKRRSPSKKWMPMDKGEATPHWKSCPGSEDFRSKREPEQQTSKPECPHNSTFTESHLICRGCGECLGVASDEVPF